MAETTGSTESAKDFGESKAGVVTRWLAEIKAYDTTFDKWTKASWRAIRRYRCESPETDDTGFVSGVPAKFAIFWSNVQTLQPALYSRVPKPDITRKHKDKNPVARASAVILERAVRSEIDTGGFDPTMRASRDDYLLTARGQAWVRYIPTYGEEKRDRVFLQADPDAEGDKPSYLMPDGAPLADDAEALFDDAGKPYIEEGEPYRPVIAECSKQEHIPWRDFGHTPAPTWEKVGAVWKREMMTRDQLVKRFGEEKGRAVGLTKVLPNVEKPDDYGDVFRRGEVYEIWDRNKGKVIWISPGYTRQPLDEIADPLKLQGFFPCPKPLYGTLTTDSLVPVPDYEEYRAQAEQIDELSQRISLLTKALRVAGAYNGAIPELQQIIEGHENRLIPVDGWAMFAQQGGLKGAIDFVPVKEVAEAIVALSNIREQLKRDLFEISGLSDLVRGQGQASATATAERIKGQFAGMRLEDRQALMGRFARDVVRITAEIVAEHFSPETLWDISGWEFSDEARALDKAVAEWEQKQQAAAMQQLAGQGAPLGPQGGPESSSIGASGGMVAGGSPPGVPPMSPRPPSSREVFDQAVEMLRSDRTRGFNIDIETDTMVFEDQQQEKQTRVEFIQAVTSYLKEAIPAMQAYPQAGPLLMEMLMFGVRGFKAGRGLEQMLEQASEEVTEMQKQPQQPDPKAQAEQAKLQAEQQKMQMEQQADQAKAQRQMALDDRKAALDERKIGMEEKKLEAEVEVIRSKAYAERQPVQDMSQMMGSLQVLMGQLAQAVTAISAPKRVIRDEDPRSPTYGQVVGVEPVTTLQ